MPTSTLVLVKNKTTNCAYVIFDLSWWKIQYPKKSLCCFRDPKKSWRLSKTQKNPFWPKCQTQKNPFKWNIINRKYAFCIPEFFSSTLSYLRKNLTTDYPHTHSAAMQWAMRCKWWQIIFICLIESTQPRSQGSLLEPGNEVGIYSVWS